MPICFKLKGKTLRFFKIVFFSCLVEKVVVYYLKDRVNLLRFGHKNLPLQTLPSGMYCVFRPGVFQYLLSNLFSILQFALWKRESKMTSFNIHDM